MFNIAAVPDGFDLEKTDKESTSQMVATGRVSTSLIKKQPDREP
jgi:hypothetical protein